MTEDRRTVKLDFDCGCFTLINLDAPRLSGTACCKQHESAGEHDPVGKTVKEVRWPPPDAYPADPDNREAWLQQRLTESREAERRLSEKNAVLEDRLGRLKVLAEELFPRPYEPTSDEIADMQT